LDVYKLKAEGEVLGNELTNGLLNDILNDPDGKIQIRVRN
jgi:hypothetical protein